MKKIMYIYLVFLAIFLFPIGVKANNTLESEVYDLTKDYIYLGIDDLDLNLINKTDEELIVEDNKLNVYYNGEIIKSYDLIKISSNQYDTLKDNYIFVGLGNPYEVRIDVTNANQRVENNYLNIYYNDTLVSKIKIISYFSDYYDLTKEYIDVGTGEVEISKISVINGEINYSSETNSVIITYSPRQGMGIILAEYPVVEYYSEIYRYDFSKDYIYTETPIQDSILLYPKLTNATSRLENNQFKIYYGNELIKSIDLVSIVTNTYSVQVGDYFYMKPSNNTPAIEITNGRYEIIDDVMNIYYKDNLIQTLKMASISSDYYDLTKDDLVIINETLDLSKINAFNCELIKDEVTDNVYVKVYGDRNHSTWTFVDTYDYFEISSDTYDLTKEYIYTGINDIDTLEINVEGGYFVGRGPHELELRNSVGRVVKTYKIVKLYNGNLYNLSKDYIFLRNQRFDIDKIEVSWGKALLEDNKLNIYYEDILLDSFDLVQILTKDYVLGNDSIYIGTVELDLNKITLTNGRLEADEDVIKMYYKDEYLGCYFITKIYSDKYDLTKNYIYTGTEPIDFTKIYFTNGSMSTSSDMIWIYNNENKVVATFDIVTLYSDAFDVKKDYIYLGTENYIDNIYTTGPTNQKIENNKLNIYYEEDLLKSFDLIKISSDKYPLYNDFIYLGIKEINTTDISITNGIIKIENNNLNIYRNEDLLASYNLVYVSSNDYDLNKKYIFVGTDEFDISKINVINATLNYHDEKVSIIYDDWSLDQFSVIKVSSDIYDIGDDRIHIGDYDADENHVMATNAIVSGIDGYFKIIFDNEVIYQYLIEANIISISSPCARYEFQLSEPETITIPIVFNPGKYIYNKTLTWTSSDESVAMVDSNGKVTPVGAGYAIITATSNNGKTSGTEIFVIGNISYSSSSYVGIYTGNVKTIKLDIETPNAQVLYSLDGDYYYSNLPTFVNPGKYKVYYMISAGDYYNIAYGDEEVAIYGINELDEQLVIKNDILVVNCFNQTFMDIKLKMKIFSEVTYNFLHYDRDLTIDEGETIRTGDYLKIKFDMEDDSYFQYRLAVLGDANGDGEISPLDYVKIKNHIMGTNLIESDAYLIASDVNSDNEISPLDYVRVKNYIMNGAL